MLKNLWNATKMAGLTVYYLLWTILSLAVDMIGLFIASGIGLVFAVIVAAEDGLDPETMKESYYDFLAEEKATIGAWLNHWGTEYKRQRLEEIWAKEEAKVSKDLETVDADAFKAGLAASLEKPSEDEA